MNETYMIPAKELSRLMNDYRGRITSDPLLTKATRLAAEQHKLLTNPNIPPGIKQALDKQIASKLSRATKKTRQEELLNTISTPRAPGQKQDPAFTNLLKKIIKGDIQDQTIATPGTPTTTSTTTTKPKRKKKEKRSGTTPGLSQLAALHLTTSQKVMTAMQKKKTVKGLFKKM